MKFEDIEECPKELLNEKETSLIDAYRNNIYGLNTIKESDASWIDIYSSNIYGLDTMKGIIK